MISRGPSVFESINARALTPSQVAQTFVPSSHFVELCRRRHSIVLGPRGSGKTTLLKMLQPAALEAWQHADAQDIANTIDFTAIFVATDISWSEQLSVIGLGALEPEFTQKLALACFTTHSLKAVVTAFQQRLGSRHTTVQRPVRRVEIKPSVEALIVSEIAKVWRIEGIAPSFYSLRQALTRRLVDIRELGSRESSLSTTGRQERLASTAYLHLPFLPAAASAIEIFEDALEIPEGKWAYSFDELELAPEIIQRELIQSIRSTDDRFLFKLALNPFTTNTYLLQSALSPAPGQDFDQISLWYAEKRVAHSFCNDLWRELARQSGVPDWSPRDVLGASYFESSEEDTESERGAYAPGSRWAKRFQALAGKDQTFRSYLDRRKIDLQKLHLMDEETRAAEVRKIAPIVALREFYLRGDNLDDQALQSIRSRKTAALYTGADSIFSLTEGNPRIFIGLVGSLLLTARGRTSSTVPPQIQAEQLLAASEKFLATLRTIPVEKTNESSGVGVLNLLRSIARYFHDDAVKDEFKAAPVGGFTIDAKTPDGILQVLGQALNAGAIIYVPDDEGKVILTSLRGKKFRLSYLLAPIYGFPIRMGRDIALSRILGIQQTSPLASDSLALDFQEKD